jgi:hypothetical protein
VGFLKEHLRPAPKVPAERLHQLVANLDSTEFTERAEAAKELKKLGMGAVTALREALEEKPPLEKKRRLEDLLKSPLSQVLFAHAAWRDNAVGRAEQMLLECAHQQRDWEWRYARHFLARARVNVPW